jgi:hypothetical protein
MTIARSQMNRQLYGIGNLVEREEYGLGSKLKSFVRKVIPNEVAQIASVAAPFVAPFNPLLAAGMSALGNFDQTGRIGSSLLRGGLTYAGGQAARYIGGAGFQQGFNPFAGADFSGGITSGLGSLFTSPIGTQTGLQLGQFTDVGRSAIDQMEPFGGSATTGTFSKAPGMLDKLGTVFSPSSSVDLGTRVRTAMDLTGDAIKKLYTDDKGNVNFRAVISTISLVPSYLEAKKKAQEAGIPPDQFNEQIYNEEKSKFQSAYQSRLPMESFGINPPPVRATAQMGGIMNSTEEQPIFPRLEILNENLGQAEQTLGQPSNQFNASSITTAITGRQPQGFAQGGRISYGIGDLVRGSGVATAIPGGTVGESKGFGGMISRLIQENPEMFKRQNTMVRPPRTMEFIDINQNAIDDRDENMMDDTGGILSIKLTPAQAKAKGGIMGSEIPLRQNPGGITELDLRAKGGYIPVGIKEKADDVPAMLSKNEFVFTADAVRGAGDGNINKGAQKMYKLMKSLEKKVKKIKKVA